MYDIITIGTATKDTFITSSLLKRVSDPDHLKEIGFISGEAVCLPSGSKVEVDKPIETLGGGGMNTAITFARQGLKVAAFLKTGKDEIADEISEKLKEEKVSPFLLKDTKLPTAHSVIILSPDGERTILVYRGASGELDLSQNFIKQIDNTKWAYITSGNIQFPILKKLIGHLHKKGISIALNPSKPLLEAGLENLKPILKKVKVFITNHEEAAFLTGIDYGNPREIFKIIDKLVDGIFIMTDGTRGTSISDNRFIYEVNIFKGKAKDETGAGDAFGSGFVAGIIRSGEKCERGKINPKNIRYAARLGSANALSVIENIGGQAGILKKRDFEKSQRWMDLDIEADQLAEGFED